MAVHVGDADAPVVGLQIQIDLLRHENLVAYRPVLMMTLLRTIGHDPATACVNHHLAGERLSLRVGISSSFDTRPDQNFGFRPAIDTHSPVHAAINGEP